MTSITVSHDLRGRFGRARDQGGRETCLAFAMSDAHGAVRTQPWLPLSTEYLFYQAKQRDKTAAHQGTTIPAIRAALVDDGQPLETAWPYMPVLPVNPKDWEPPTDVGALHRRMSTERDHAFDEVWCAVEADQPTLIGMTLSSAFYVPEKDGIVDSDEPADPDLRHAVVAVATGRRAKRRMLLVRNSWGDSWGLSGYAWLSDRYAAPRILVAVTLN